MRQNLLKKEGELHGSEAVIYFDDIKDDNGNRAVKDKKRSRLILLMKELYNDEERNKCLLDDGRVVPIIVTRRKAEYHASYCYFNTADAPQEEILQAFANQMNVTYKEDNPPLRQEGELIANSVLYLFDDVKVSGKKVTGLMKQQTLMKLFKTLYENSEDNTVITKNKKKPIIVKRIGINNCIAYCLNAKEDKKEVLSAFAKWAGCTYCIEKEDEEEPPAKQKGEMTTRECAKIFHNVPYRHQYLKYTSERLMEWYAYIIEHERLNKVQLPTKEEVPLIVARKSYSQKCHCLNTADEAIKPFVIRKVAEIIEATICLENLKIKNENPSGLKKAIMLLARAEQECINNKDKEFYHSYAQKAFRALSPKTDSNNVQDWLIELAQKSKP